MASKHDTTFDCLLDFQVLPEPNITLKIHSGMAIARRVEQGQGSQQQKGKEHLAERASQRIFLNSLCGCIRVSRSSLSTRVFLRASLQALRTGWSAC